MLAVCNHIHLKKIKFREAQIQYKIYVIYSHSNNIYSCGRGKHISNNYSDTPVTAINVVTVYI